jgi:hypothetical protein
MGSSTPLPQYGGGNLSMLAQPGSNSGHRSNPYPSGRGTPANSQNYAAHFLERPSGKQLPPNTSVQSHGWPEVSDYDHTGRVSNNVSHVSAKTSNGLESSAVPTAQDLQMSPEEYAQAVSNAHARHNDASFQTAAADMKALQQTQGCANASASTGVNPTFANSSTGQSSSGDSSSLAAGVPSSVTASNGGDNGALPPSSNGPPQSSPHVQGGAPDNAQFAPANLCNNDFEATSRFKSIPLSSLDVLNTVSGHMKIFHMLPAKIERLLNCEGLEAVKSLLMTCALSSHAFHDKRDDFIMDWLRNYQYLVRRITYNQVIESCPAICLVVILGCAGVNTGLLCVQEALWLYKKHVNANLNVHIMEVWVYETDEIT